MKSGVENTENIDLSSLPMPTWIIISLYTMHIMHTPHSYICIHVYTQFYSEMIPILQKSCKRGLKEFLYAVNLEFPNSNITLSDI